MSDGEVRLDLGWYDHADLTPLVSWCGREFGAPLGLTRNSAVDEPLAPDRTWDFFLTETDHAGRMRAVFVFRTEEMAMRFAMRCA